MYIFLFLVLDELKFQKYVNSIINLILDREFYWNYKFNRDWIVI
jgi:hypothetical protein